MSLEQIWTTELNPGGKLEAPPTVANGTVYVAAGCGVEAFDANTGQQTFQFYWDYSEEPGFAKHRPVAYDDYLFVGSYDSAVDNDEGVLHALDANTGMEGWRYERENAGVTGVAPHEDKVVASLGSALVALDVTDGSKLWVFESDDDGAFGSPVVADGVVCAVHESGEVYALDATTGDGVWSLTLGTEILDWWNRPDVHGTTVYVGDGDSVYAVDAETGRGEWSVSADGDTQRPVYGNGSVYIGGDVRSNDEVVTAIAADSGDVRWTTQLKPGLTPPGVGERGVYVAGGSHLFELDPEDGHRHDSLRLPEDELGQPAVTETAAFVGDAGPVHAVDLFGEGPLGERPAIGEDPPPGFQHRDIASTTEPSATTDETAADDASDDSHTCPDCGETISTDGTFCPHCGTEIDPETCPNCGTKTDPDANFCMNCGEEV